MTRTVLVFMVLVQSWCLGAPEVWQEWKRRAKVLWTNEHAAGNGSARLVPRLLPGTQQPAPAMLMLGTPGDRGVSMAAWLHRQGVHVLFLDAVPMADPRRAVPAVQRALRMIRSHAAAWQIDADAIALLACDAGCGAVAIQTAQAGAQARYTASDRVDRERPEPDMLILLNAGDGAALQAIPASGRPDLFAAQGDAWQSRLAAWLEAYKGTVF